MEELIRRARFWFWMRVHNAAEMFWHWVYYKHVVPNRPNPRFNLPNAMYFMGEYGVWRQNPDGTHTKISNGIDVGQ